MPRRTLHASLALAALALMPRLASARAQSAGWALNRYDAPFGGDLTLVADTPWYTGDASFLLRATITGDYAYRPLVLRARSNDTVLVEHMLVGHAQIAAAFADRIGLSLTLPSRCCSRGPTSRGEWSRRPRGASHCQTSAWRRACGSSVTPTSTRSRCTWACRRTSRGSGAAPRTPPTTHFGSAPE